MKFINRDQELQDLEKRWKSDKSELFIVYGKRRVGKTELLKQFIQKKHAVYFLADKRTMANQLKELARLMASAFSDPLIEKQGFGNWLDVFQYVQRNAEERFVLVVDEFPYLAEVDSATSSIFQKGWDEFLKEKNVMLVLLGSSIAMMESEILIQKAPLFGRRTGQLPLRPLTFFGSWQFFPEKKFKEFIQVYTITGGMPAYLLQMDTEHNVEENIKRHVFPKTEFLHNEIEFVLKEELREPKNYLAILQAIAWGKRKLSEIVNYTSFEKSLVNKYLHTLIQLQIVERELPLIEKNPQRSRKGLYRLCDNFFRFWFQYIFPYHSDLEIQRYDEVLRKFHESFNTLTATTYERVCREIVRTFEAGLFPFERVGKWWDKNEEIDLVALNSQTKDILFGECKWSEKQVGTNVFVALKKKARFVDWHKTSRKDHYILFSKSGFTPNMVELAKKDGILLVQEDTLIHEQ